MYCTIDCICSSIYSLADRPLNVKGLNNYAESYFTKIPILVLNRAALRAFFRTDQYLVKKKKEDEVHLGVLLVLQNCWRIFCLTSYSSLNEISIMHGAQKHGLFKPND